MLIKLIKNEFKATSRIYLPMFGVLFLFTAINKFFMLFRSDSFSAPQGIAMAGYIMVIAAIAAITIIMAIQRFHKNLLGDEGYLMFTLPVKSGQLILSKLIPAAVWSVLSGVVAVLSIIVITMNKSFFTELGNMFHMIISQWSENMPISMFSMIVYFALYIALAEMSTYLMIYLSIAIGHQMPKSRMLASFGAFLVLNIAIQTLTTFGVIFADKINLFSLFNNMNATTQFHTLAWLGIIVTGAFCAVTFWGTNFLLKKHLNLE